MKLIIEKDHRSICAYRETEKQFARNEPERRTVRLEGTELNNECDLALYESFHMVFELMEPKKGLTRRLRTKIADTLDRVEQWLRREDNSLRDTMPFFRSFACGLFTIAIVIFMPLVLVGAISDVYQILVSLLQ